MAILDRSDFDSCFARGARQSPFSTMSYRYAKPRGCGDVVRQGPWRVYPFVLAQITCCVGRKMERPDEMFNGPKATEASARFVMPRAAAVLVCSSEAGSAGKQLPILPLLQNNLCVSSSLRNTVVLKVYVWILRAYYRKHAQLNHLQPIRWPSPPCLLPPMSSRSSPRPQSSRKMSQKQPRSHSRAFAISRQAVWEVSSQW
jgi:hypothetical protein